MINPDAVLGGREAADINAQLATKLDTSAAPATVRAVPLTGLSTATATAITAADSALSAAGKLQAQATANASAIGNKIDTSAVPAAVRATALTGLSTATAAPITAADTMLSASGKLQAQISGLGNGYEFLFSRGRANLNRLLFTSLNPAQIIHNGQLTVPAEYNVIGGACLFEFDLYTSATAAHRGTFRIFVSEVNLINSGATNIGASSTNGVALSCQFSFVRATATHVVLALRVNGTLVAKQRVSGPNIPAVGAAANFSIRWLSSTTEASLEYVESMVTMGYGNKP